MLLAIDVGNTNIVFAIVDNGEIRWRWRISTAPDRTADEYAVWLNQLMALEGVERAHVDAAIIATVVPPTLFNLQRLCRKYFNVEPLVVGDEGVRYGIALAVDNRREVGADRIVNAVAAHASHAGQPDRRRHSAPRRRSDVITEDADGHGVYRGGAIAPGINLSMDALYSHAAKLPRIAVEPPPGNGSAIGTNTVHAMQAGVFWGYVGLIEGLVKRITSEIGGPVTVIGTGGLATLFNRHTPAIDRVDGDLTIRGLHRIFVLNQSGA